MTVSIRLLMPELAEVLRRLRRLLASEGAGAAQRRRKRKIRQRPVAVSPGALAMLKQRRECKEGW